MPYATYTETLLNSFRCPICNQSVEVLHTQNPATGENTGERYLAHHPIVPQTDTWIVKNCPLGGEPVEPTRELAKHLAL